MEGRREGEEIERGSKQEGNGEREMGRLGTGDIVRCSFTKIIESSGGFTLPSASHVIRLAVVVIKLSNVTHALLYVLLQ